MTIYISFRGIFEFRDINNQEDIETFLRIQAVHIMFPYLRSMLTNLTNTVMMPPLILPIIDASQLFKNGDVEININ
jgi:preprotein translocase subunit SecB